MTRLFVIAIVLLAMTATVFSQEPGQKTPIESEGLAPTALHCFTSGSDATFLNVCLTDNGTISSFEAPLNKLHIRGNEGYAVCDAGGALPIAFDAGLAADGWDAPTVSQPKGAGKFPFIVTRNSTNGQALLKQTFNLDTVQRQLTVKMDLKNTSGVAFSFPVVTRYFDGDIDNSSANFYHTTFDSVAGRGVFSGSNTSEHAVILSLGSTLAALHLARAESFANWNPLIPGGPQTARSCAATATGSETASDQIGRLAVAPADTLKPGQTKSVTFQYRVF